MYLIAVFNQATSYFQVVAREEDLDEAVHTAEGILDHQAIVMERVEKGYQVYWPKKLVLGTEVS